MEIIPKIKGSEKEIHKSRSIQKTILQKLIRKINQKITSKSLEDLFLTISASHDIAQTILLCDNPDYIKRWEDIDINSLMKSAEYRKRIELHEKIYPLASAVEYFGKDPNFKEPK